MYENQIFSLKSGVYYEEIDDGQPKEIPRAWLDTLWALTGEIKLCGWFNGSPSTTWYELEKLEDYEGPEWIYIIDKNILGDQNA